MRGDKMVFGKYRGRLIQDLPNEYLINQWEIHEEDYKGLNITFEPLLTLLEYIKDTLDFTQLNTKTN